MKMKKITVCIVTLFLFGIWGHAFAMDIIPQMKECMRSHGSQEQYRPVIQKYADPAIANDAMGLLIVKEPYITRADKEGQAICYTVAGVAVATVTEAPYDVVQTYGVCWEHGRIVSFSPLGAERVTPEPLSFERWYELLNIKTEVIDKWGENVRALITDEDLTVEEAKALEARLAAHPLLGQDMMH